MTTIDVVLGSTRPNRFAEKPARWVLERLNARPGVEARLVDLRDHPLPFFDREAPPAYTGREHPTPETARFAATIDQADGYVFVTPEYNHGISGALKNAIDFLFAEWNNKAAGFVSYGGVSAGSRAVEVIKQIATTLKMMPIPEAISIPFVFRLIQGSHFKPEPELEYAATAMLDELRRWADALSGFRAPHEPPAVSRDGVDAGPAAMTHFRG